MVLEFGRIVVHAWGPESPFCGFDSGPPNSWPEENRFCRDWKEHPEHVSCPACLVKIHEKLKPSKPSAIKA
jgi:hypothetical protein